MSLLFTRFIVKELGISDINQIDHLRKVRLAPGSDLIPEGYLALMVVYTFEHFKLPSTLEFYFLIFQEQIHDSQKPIVVAVRSERVKILCSNFVYVGILLNSFNFTVHKSLLEYY